MVPRARNCGAQCFQGSLSAQTVFFEDFNGPVLPGNWMDISTSAYHPTIGTLDGRTVLIMSRNGGGWSSDYDVGIEYTGLNPTDSPRWRIEFVAKDGIQRDWCDCAWAIGVGNLPPGAIGGHFAALAVGYGLGWSNSADFDGHLWWSEEYNPYFSTGVLRDDGFHKFQIESDGQDLRYYIDGALVRMEIAKAFPAHRIAMGILAAETPGTSALWVDSVTFTVDPPDIEQPPCQACQDALSAAQQQILALQTQLDAVNGAIQTLQGQVTSLTSQNSLLQTQVANLMSQNSQLQGKLTQLNSTLSSNLASVQADFRSMFGDPGFTIPGSTNVLQYQNLIQAI
jgi:hypothetical protein